jgi:acyl carrier protein
VTEKKLINILDYVLQLGARRQNLRKETALLKAIPELDSVAVVSIVAEIERQFGITIDDSEISASTFETLGSLVAVVDAKRG